MGGMYECKSVPRGCKQVEQYNRVEFWKLYAIAGPRENMGAFEGGRVRYFFVTGVRFIFKENVLCMSERLLVWEMFCKRTERVEKYASNIQWHCIYCTQGQDVCRTDANKRMARGSLSHYQCWTELESV